MTLVRFFIAENCLSSDVGHGRDARDEEIIFASKGRKGERMGETSKEILKHAVKQLTKLKYCAYEVRTYDVRRTIKTNRIIAITSYYLDSSSKVKNAPSVSVDKKYPSAINDIIIGI